MAEGLEQGAWGLGRVSKGLGGWGLDGAKGRGLGGGGGWTLGGRDERTFVRSLAPSLSRSDGQTEIPPSSIGHRSLWVRCPKWADLRLKKLGAKMEQI